MSVGMAEPASPDTAREATVWHSLTAEEASAQLGVDPARGLKAAEVERRRATFGPNKLAEAKKEPGWQAFLRQYRDLMQLVLLGAAIVSIVALQEFSTGLVIIGLTVLNAVLGLNQEGKAAESVAALQKMLIIRAHVRRDGRRDDVPLGDRVDIAYMNSTVTRGRGEMVVTTTGMATQVGRISGMLSQLQQEKTPLTRQLDQLTVLLTIMAGAALALVVVIGLLRGDDFDELFIIGISLAVAAIPTGLPAVVTTVLSLGTQALAAKGAIVKRLRSVETLGSTSAICSDKTGTLTLNQMTARELVVAGHRYSVNGEGYSTTGRVLHVAGDVELPNGGPLLRQGRPRRPARPVDALPRRQPVPPADDRRGRGPGGRRERPPGRRGPAGAGRGPARLRPRRLRPPGR